LPPSSWQIHLFKVAANWTGRRGLVEYVGRFAKIVVNEKCDKGNRGNTFFQNVGANLSA
jgi:hypothetical protein